MALKKLENVYMDVEKTLGTLKFQKLEREVFVRDMVTRRPTTVVEARIYRLFSEEQMDTIDITVPVIKVADPIEIERGAVVELVNPLANFGGSVISRGSFNQVDLTTTVIVDNIIAKGGKSNQSKPI